MGRPRKQRPAEAADSQPTVSVPTEAPKKEAETAPFVIPDFQFDGTIGMDLDLSFLDVNNTDVNFLELVDPNSQVLPAPDHTYADQGGAGFKEAAVPNPPIPTGGFWRLGENLDTINFDEPIGAPAAPPPAPEITAEEVAQIFAYDIAETLPSLSPPSSNSPSTQASPSESDNSRPCGCLPSLYLALDSLQTLPSEVGEAMRVARTATKAAHDAILCPVCSEIPTDPVCKPPMRAFQSMMMLGALLPSVSHAYMRILSMVDAEAAAADAERRKICFSLSRYGGLWGSMARLDLVKCGASERLEGAMLEPILWRLTVRAMLKMDVYGVNCLTPGVPDEDIQQPGLKDIITMMEERSRRRHEQLDALVASGAVDKLPAEYVPLSSNGDKPTCLRIIDIAKRSMDDLIIP
ncbi:uncharacterized protein THITE_2121610 [Thermothielavioides terrestris NRRL 8126]|uniref:Uncharacterized protein n=1 Tax=Thermothielavioides terrestris (strain ATCC 38088 / NRRL 8126) TaxID=578455 RepID=G2RF42_THETT|nr:uncharacterized protein THITE_2121610 [Thermothielavioides terrestris NRRL 8126]AEO70325.1 hypothetical protein THITE_2121610 [Thermothielavioides terrestris NRRL 8126]